MSDSALPSPEAAAEVFFAVLDEAGEHVSGLTATTALKHFGTFARQGFNVPPGPESDGLLFQFGTFSFTGERRFHLDLVRQFSGVDEDEYLQFHCDLRFTPSDELDALGRLEDWWWPEAGPTLDQWLEGIAGRPELRFLAAARPTFVAAWVDQT